jgi:hypothetical protein
MNDFFGSGCEKGETCTEALYSQKAGVVVSLGSWIV